MKVGTDGILLGAWATIDGAESILDIGTGSGVIALMMAQRSKPGTHIDAIEVNDDAAMDAIENFSHSPWKKNIHLYHTTLQNFQTETRYDLIITNPPYFVNSQKSPDKNRHIARHSESLKPEELLFSISNFLKSSGRLAIILPPTEAAKFKSMASTIHSLYCIRECSFIPRQHKPIERMLMEFSHQTVPKVVEELILYRQVEEWTETYRSLVKDFYLKG